MQEPVISPLYAAVITLILGFVIHIIKKFDSLTELHQKANEPYSPARFLRDHKRAIIISIICIIMWILFLPYTFMAVPSIGGNEWFAVIGHMALAFVMGYGNSSIVLSFGNKGRKYVLNKIDEKTNIADAVINSTKDEGIQ